MTLRQEIDHQRHRARPGDPASSLMSGIDLPGPPQRASAAPPEIVNRQSPIDNPLCPCGSPVDPDLLEIRTLLPSLSPDLCTACYAAQAREDADRQREEMDRADHRARLARVDALATQAGPKVLATDLGFRTFNAALYLATQDWTPESRRWLVLHGPPGSCKTRIAALIAKRLILDGRHVAWTTAGKLQTTVADLHTYTKAAEQQRHTARQLLRTWTEAGILVIDDLGKNTWTPTLEAAFFELIDHRETRWLPTIITSNRPITDLLAEMSVDRGGPIIGRIQAAAAGWILRADPVSARGSIQYSIPNHQ